MKSVKRLYGIILLAMVSIQLSAQAPQGINYQSVARNGAGLILVNQTISLRLSIHDSIPGGPVVYRENHSVLTSQFGTFSVVIGGGVIQAGNFGTIDWSNDPKHLQVEMDFTGGGTYTDMGTAQLMSVPYSLYANSAGGSVSNVKFDTAGTINVLTIGGATVSSVKSAWLTTGNGGLSSANNFIGTTDNTDLIIKRGAIEGMRMTTGGALLATGSAAGVTPASGAGKRMMWIPAKGAFRAGSVSGTFWDDVNVGTNSIAMGNDVLASGASAIAIGNNARAIGDRSIAIGDGVIAKAYRSMVVGMNNDTLNSGSPTILDTSAVLFQVGNGKTSATRTNALTVNKSGQVSAAQLVVGQSMTLSDTVVNVNSNFTLTVNNALILINSSVGAGGAVITLNPGKIGQVVMIEVVASGGHGVRFKDNAANGLNLPIDQDLNGSDTITLLYDGSTWTQLSASSNH